MCQDEYQGSEDASEKGTGVGRAQHPPPNPTPGASQPSFQNLVDLGSDLSNLAPLEEWVVNIPLHL